MKRIITILLILMITCTLFAASGETNTVLELTSTVDGKLFHGFTSSQVTTANAIRDNAFSHATKTVDLESTSAQAVGYYNIYTTGASQFKVDFTVNPLTLDLDDDNTADYYVPYQLGYTAGSFGNLSAQITGNTVGTVSPATTSTPAAVSPVTVLTTTGNGLRYQTIELSATFDGEGNSSFGLPETPSGVFYTGTIQVNVTSVE